MARLSQDHLLQNLAHDPSLYPQNLSFVRRQALFLRLGRAALETASFLDDRILTPQSEGGWLDLGALEQALQRLPAQPPLHFIFHAGHVGSTLVSRLLDELGGVLGLREPLPLRVLAEAFDDAAAMHALVSQQQADQTLAAFCQLWRRGYADTKAVIVKATSSAGRISSHILDAQPGARAIFLNLRAEPYLATLLGGQNSAIDLRGQGPERYRRLARLGAAQPSPLHAMSLGEMAAMTWLAETLTQVETQRAHGHRLLFVDFDAFLNAPALTLQAIAGQFGLTAPDSVLERVAAGPTLQRYSKAPDQPYSPQLRQHVLAQSRQHNSHEIRKGLAWLEQLAREFPAAARVL